MDCNVIIESNVKFRDRKIWRTWWCVVRKLSPAADCLHLQLYRDSKDRYKQGMTKASLSLENFLGTESGFTLDKESNTVAIICREITVILAFDSRERLIQWQMKINNHLGESVQFLIQISSSPAKAKINPGPAKLHIQNHNFCLTSGVPSKLIGYWEIKHLRRYGVIDGKFCFEGGSLCGKGEGLYVLLSDECEEISWNVQMASEGRLIPKRRFMTRNMSVTESPNRYIHNLSESKASGIGNIMSNTQNNSCQSFRMYEWASVESVQDTDPDDKIPGDYGSSSSCINMRAPLTRSNFVNFSNGLSLRSTDRESESNYDVYVSTNNITNGDCYSELKESESFDGDGYQKEEKAPERPPKPLKFRTEESEIAVIKQMASRCNNINSKESVAKIDISLRNSGNDSLRYLDCDQVDQYDVPKTFHSSSQPQVADHLCVCVVPHKNVKHELDSKKIQSTDYDVPPAAVPVNPVCSCTSKMRVVVESEECHSHKLNITCPCQHFITCWPYNWLQLAYCRRGNTIQDTSNSLNIANRTKPKTDFNSTPIYAKVDLSKKTKYKPAECGTDSKPKRPIEPKARYETCHQDSESNNSYTNLYFENSLKYYENARELIKNNFNSVSKTETADSSEKCASDQFCTKCSQLQNNSSTTSKEQENYIIMNPICSILQDTSLAFTDSHSVPDISLKQKPRCINLEQSKEKFTLGKERSDLLDSIKSVPYALQSVRMQEMNQKSEVLKSLDVKEENQKSPKFDATRCKSKSSGNRDSSSSNDSGFSFGSLKLQGNENVDSEILQQSISMRKNSFSTLNTTVLSPKTTRSKLSYDSLKETSFPFNQETTSIADDFNELNYRQKIVCKKDSGSLRSDGTSSIPYIDSQSTSSETSDMSDYIETLSMSSHSSSETASNTKLQHPAASILRPRSGKEYEKVNRVLLQHSSNCQNIMEERIFP